MKRLLLDALALAFAAACLWLAVGCCRAADPVRVAVEFKGLFVQNGGKKPAGCDLWDGRIKKSQTNFADPLWRSTVLAENFNLVEVKTGGFFQDIVFALPNGRVFQARAVLVVDLTGPGTTLVEEKK